MYLKNYIERAHRVDDGMEIGLGTRTKRAFGSLRLSAQPNKRPGFARSVLWYAHFIRIYMSCDPKLSFDVSCYQLSQTGCNPLIFSYFLASVFKKNVVGGGAI